jgi:hypothetical protein
VRPAVGAPLPPTPAISYVYDELGWLLAVVGPAPGTATYSGDADGNHTSIGVASIGRTGATSASAEFTPPTARRSVRVNLWHRLQHDAEPGHAARR